MSTSPGTAVISPQPVDVYVYRVVDGIPEFLLMKRSSGKIYQNQWRMVGGKTDAGETRWQAALRELKEETGITPISFWTVPSINHFYDHRKDVIHLIPAFAAETEPDVEIRLDAEHTEFRWVSLAQVDSMIQWPEQRRLMELVHRIVLKGERLPEWDLHLP